MTVPTDDEISLPLAQHRLSHKCHIPLCLCWQLVLSHSTYNTVSVTA